MWPGAGWKGGQAQFERGLEGSDGHGRMDTREEGVPGEGGEYESRCEVGLCRRADDRGMGEALSRDPGFPSSRDRQGPLLADCVHCSLSCANLAGFRGRLAPPLVKSDGLAASRSSTGLEGLQPFPLGRQSACCPVLVTEASGPTLAWLALVSSTLLPPGGAGVPPLWISPHIYSPMHWAQSLCRT